MYDATNDPNHYHFSANTFLPDSHAAGFANIATHDFQLTSQSPAINAGEDYTWLASNDFDGAPRSHNSSDNGAYTYQTLAPYNINFSSTNISNGWYNYLPAYHDTSVRYVENQDGEHTIGLAITANFCGDKETIYAMGSQLDSIPNEVLQSFWYTCSSKAGELTITGLNPSITYDISLMASRITNQDRVTEYTLAGQTQLLTVTNNDSDIVLFESVNSESGTLTLSVSSHDTGNGNPYGYLNGLIITPK